MTEEDRKVRTEYRGLSWKPECDECRLSKALMARNANAPCTHDPGNPTYTIPADLHAVYNRMWERGDWEYFYSFARAEWDLISSGCWDFEFSAWLFCLNCPEQIPDRMKMACGFIRERNI